MRRPGRRSIGSAAECSSRFSWGEHVITRRAVVQAGLAACSLIATLPAAGSAPRRPRSPVTSFYRVLVDTRFAASRRFGTALPSGTAIAAVGANITDLWFRDLAPHWRSEAAPIAGMTVYPVFFALEQMARDAGLRVALRIEHHVAPEGITHVVRAPRASRPALQSLVTADNAWPEVVSTLVMDPAPPAVLMDFRLATRLHESAPEAEPLVTFVLLPPPGRTGVLS
jgi:hypothetical protein